MFTFAKEINMTPEVLKDAIGDTVLERLQAALDGIDERTFEFVSWSQCTCGHIYRAALGRPAATDPEVYQSQDDTFRELLEVVAVANGHDPDHDREASDPTHAYSVDRLSSVVSDMTSDRALEDTNEAKRDCAIVLIRNAIAFEVQRNEQARLALIGGAA